MVSGHSSSSQGALEETVNMDKEKLQMKWEDEARDQYKCTYAGGLQTHLTVFWFFFLLCSLIVYSQLGIGS